MISTKRLKAIAHLLPELARECQQRVADQFKVFVQQELQRQHHTGRSIYGDTYPKPKKGNQPMFDTGELEGGYNEVGIEQFARLAVKNNIDLDLIKNDSEHTVVNSDGLHPHLPDDRGMPKRWADKLAQIKRAEERRFVEKVNKL